MPKSVVSIHVMGCRLNHAEAAVIAGALERAGFVVDFACEAVSPDVFLLHTCAVTASAQTEAMRRIRGAKRSGARSVVVSGCTANIASRLALQDAGADQIATRHDAGQPSSPSDTDDAKVAAVVRAALRMNAEVAAPSAVFASTRAPVKIQDGCSFRCSYCIVPDARGEPRSKPLLAVIEECRSLVARGYRELVLTGVNVACWASGGKSFYDLVHEVASIDGLLRLRMSSVEPHTTEKAVFDLLAEPGSKLCHTLHYPLQSGSDKILSLMRRRYTVAEYRQSLDYVLERIPDIGLGADIMTGFPGETDSDFAQTRALVEAYPFSNLHVFPYSERPGTPAASFPDVVPVNVRRERARELISLGLRKRIDFAKSFIGKKVQVLVEKSTAGISTGWSSQYIATRIRGEYAPGSLVVATIVESDNESIIGNPA